MNYGNDLVGMVSRGGYGYDWTYILIIIGFLLSLFASGYVKSTFAKYAKVVALSQMTGAEAAQKMLHDNGIYDVTIQHISGNLTDNYNPKSKVLSLSDSVFASRSIAAIGVACHECGHAIQHNEEYEPLKLRSAIVPAANFGSRFGVWIFLAGVLLSYFRPLIFIGIVLFAFGVVFHLVTLPVEFNASGRALDYLKSSSMLSDDEVRGAGAVLKSAAMTYVAAAAASCLQLLRFILIANGGRRRRD